MRTYFKNGSWNCDCDVCGLRFKADQIVRRWDGAMTCKTCYEPRHPQDFIRVRDERVSVPFTRPEADLFVPQTTGVLFSESVSISETINVSSIFIRKIPNLGMFTEPLDGVQRFLGYSVLDFETLGGIGRESDIPKESLTITEVITYSTTSLVDGRALNSFLLNSITLG